MSTIEKKKIPWLVRVHHRLRTLSFAMVFGATCFQIGTRGNVGWVGWTLLVLLLLIYPHVQYWRAVRSRQPVQTELRSLVMDSFLLGMYIAGIGFAHWLSYSAMLGTMINNVVNKGLRGTLQTLVALAAGMLIWIACVGFRFEPETPWTVIVFCIVGLTLYVVLMGNVGYIRNCALRGVREKLKHQEAELLTANQAMQRHLAEIDGLHAQLVEQANRDPLTTLYNRRYLNAILPRELARCQREQRPLTLILLDIDHFKKVNDGFGHPAGDEVLIRIGGLLSEGARASDVVCRLGGEEFLILAPTMPVEMAAMYGEKLRQVIGGMGIAFQDQRLAVSVSLGIAVYPQHGQDADALIRCADAALYRAKQNGRNRVEIGPEADEPIPLA